ncbi:HPr family phosphocarrier protein [Cohnella thermotolerans]|uniref:HPr family phosphocarrier protein n=1 Tax=Cohnella thermotolerans TaxID=329858 RepID=UPI000407D486|nr:HPr family phosphocarrier protein [Cohnella thermotolerans]
MIAHTFKIINPQGFHVRPTKIFVDKATLYPCKIFLVHNNKRANGKSSLGVMSLGLACNAEVTLEIDGDQERKAMEELGELLTRIYD